VAKKGSGNKSKSGGASAGKRTLKKGGAPLKDLDAKKGRQVRGGSLTYGGIKWDYKEQKPDGSL
jgi:hypothetical protein